MSDFFNQYENSSRTIQEKDVESVSNFAGITPETPLGNLPKYEDIYGKTVNPTIDNAVIDYSKSSAVETDVFADREFKKETDKSKQIIKARVKAFLSAYFLITLVLFSFVIYNIVATVLLSNKASNNNIRIKEINKAIDKMNNNDNSNTGNIEIPQDLNL